MAKIAMIGFTVFSGIIFPPLLVLTVPTTIAILVTSQSEEKRRLEQARRAHMVKTRTQVGKFFAS